MWVEKHQHSVRTLTTLWDGGNGEEGGEGVGSEAGGGGSSSGGGGGGGGGNPPSENNDEGSAMSSSVSRKNTGEGAGSSSAVAAPTGAPGALPAVEGLPSPAGEREDWYLQRCSQGCQGGRGQSPLVLKYPNP